MAKTSKGKNLTAPHDPIFTLPPYKVEKVYAAASETVDWGLELLGIPALWRQTRGSGIRVAVLDTGIALNHPDLKDAVEEAKDFTGSESGSNDVDGHGTHVSGIIAARENSSGVIGVAPQAKLLVGKVLGDNGSGTMEAVESGIRWATEQKADLISMSLGSQYPSERLHKAVQDAVKAGVFVICAAGNEGPSLETVSYPAIYDETVAVGSIDRRKGISSFSSRGKEVDIVAPGDDILSTFPPRGLARLSGTSMATPFVSGVVALTLAKHKQHGGDTPISTYKELLEHLTKTAFDLGPEGFDPAYGYGLINPEDLLRSKSAMLLNLTASEDLTALGQKKLEGFLGSVAVKRVSGEAYLEGSIRGGQGEVRGGIRIRF